MSRSQSKVTLKTKIIQGHYPESQGAFIIHIHRINFCWILYFQFMKDFRRNRLSVAFTESGLTSTKLSIAYQNIFGDNTI